ncbi:hypothetical protein M8R61_21185 [Enterobacter hormaechei]|nr:hypothetical protein [Enterobacter hormaechei]
MTLTKEWLRKTIAELEEERDATPGAVNEDAAMALAAMKIALASLEAKSKLSNFIATQESLGVAFERVLAENIEELYVPSKSTPPVSVSVPYYPETLPCPVMLEPGLRFGKGVPTKTMLGALQRRAEYYAELDAMTPDQRAEHEAGMKEFDYMLQGAEPVKTANKLPEPIKDNRLNSGAEADDYYSGYQAGWNECLESVQVICEGNPDAK